MVNSARSLTIAAASVVVSCALSGQQPKRASDSYVTPLLPAEQAWAVALPSLPAAHAVMDSTAVYVPITATTRENDEGDEVSQPAALVAIDRESGVTRWTHQVVTRLPAVRAQGFVIAAEASVLRALDPESGEARWSATLDRPVRAPMIARGALILALLEGDELVAFDMARRQVAWRRSVGESGPVLMTADDHAAYLVTAGSRALRVMLADGALAWERPLDGELSAPTVDRDLLFVGSNHRRGSLWALNTSTGENRWVWDGGVFGGPIVGTAVAGETVYAVSKDNMLRALNRGNGSQRWQEPAGMRPLAPPGLLEGIVAVSGGGALPTLSSFRTRDGGAVSTWSGPENALLEGPPLIDVPRPLRVAIVALFRDGRLVGLRPTAMLFKEGDLAPLSTLPGRPLSREN